MTIFLQKIDPRWNEYKEKEDDRRTPHHQKMYEEGYELDVFYNSFYYNYLLGYIVYTQHIWTGKGVAVVLFT